MNSFLRSLPPFFLVWTVLVVLPPASDAQTAKPTATPVPKVVPMAISADSAPFLAANRSLEPTDLKKFNYVEEEFLVTGTANVYDWAADGTLSVKTPNAPYGTRILVRRPADPSRFSGNVVVEPLNAVRRFDWSWMWGYIDEQVLQSGDVWVGITMPGSSAAIKKFNPTRYAAVSFANPTPGVACPPAPGAAAGANNAPPEIEDGLRWDAISQVGALLKSNAASGPLAGFRVQAIYMTMGQSPEIMTYINAIHSHATLSTGKPVYDGYLVKQPGNPARINACAPALDAADPRRTFKATNVPVIAVVAQGELTGGLPWRRADSDTPTDMFRQYEIAGAAHIEWDTYIALPSFPDQTAAGIMPPGTPEFPFAARCDPDIPLKALPIMGQTFHAALANLEQWVRKGTPAPRAPRLEVTDAGTPQAAVKTDDHGNGIGGVRSVYMDVPTATVIPNSPGPGNCREMGHKNDFDAARIQTMYGGQKNYAAKVSASVDKLVKERWLTEADGKKIKQELAER
jgi:alpha/beta hydrolase family protein